MRAHLTPQAEIDLEEIGDYIPRSTTPSGLSHSFERYGNIARRLPMGRAAMWRALTWATRYGICAHGNYLIIFEPFDDGALILRVLHGARNVPGVFGSS